MFRIFGTLMMLWLIHNVAFGQLLFEIKSDADFVDVDNMENIYAVKGSEVKKYNSTGAFLFRYSNKINGMVSCLDATNPLRVLLFYNESNTVSFLNQQLSLISDPVNIFEAVNIEASVAGVSSHSGFWVFSLDRQSLMLFNSKMELVQESQNLSGWIEGANVEFIREQNQKVYIGMAHKVLVFDMFGSYLTTVHFENAQFLKMSGDKMSYLKDQNMWVYNLTLKTDVQYPNQNVVGLKNIFCYKNRIYCVFDGYISIYKIN